MATLREILQKAGTLENAERVARLLSKNDPKYLMDLQLVLSAQGKVDEAWKVSDKAMHLFPGDYRVAFNRGWLVMRKGNLYKGFCLMEKGRYVRLWGNAPLPSKKPLWNGSQDLKGKSVLFYNEAGLGDEIVYVRFAARMAEQGARVIVASDAGLMSVFARMKGISGVIDKRAALAMYHDYWVPSMSLGRLCKLEYEDLDGRPYLTASPEYLSRWKEIIKPGGVKVGIRWSGNPEFEHDQFRSLPAEKMMRLADVPGVQLYSFQRDTDLSYLPDNIVDLQKLLVTWEDTAAAMKQLDLMITSCTSVAHMSAALGVPTWVIVPIMPYYVWALPGNMTPWYNSVRIFRQKKFSDWKGPLKKVKKALRAFVRE